MGDEDPAPAPGLLLRLLLRRVVGGGEDGDATGAGAGGEEGGVGVDGGDEGDDGLVEEALRGPVGLRRGDGRQGLGFPAVEVHSGGV